MANTPEKRNTEHTESTERDEAQTIQPIDQGELREESAEELPDREAMSLVNANLAVPVNLAAALNVLSDNSTAGAGAIQQDPIGQNT